VQYLGGKFRIAKQIASILGPNPVLEPFMGGANVSVHLPEGSICSDLDPSLASLYQHVQANGVDSLPERLTKDVYDALKATEDPCNPLTAFAKYGCSYAGKPWGGWAKPNPNQSRTGYYSTCARNALKRLQGLQVTFQSGSFFDLHPGDFLGFTLYLDPPYLGTTGYKTAFDYDLFLSTVRMWARTNPVYVSEYQSQDSTWELVQEFPKAKYGLQVREATHLGETEKLFKVWATH